MKRRRNDAWPLEVCIRLQIRTQPNDETEVAEILFDDISRMLELVVRTQGGEALRGRLNLTRIQGENGDFILSGLGVNDGREHQFPLSGVLEIIDIETGENVDIAEFRNELMAHGGA